MSKFNDEMIAKRVPKVIKERTKANMEQFGIGLYDAFKEAVRSYSKPSKRLQAAFMTDDYREYIPSEYLPEYLDFDKHPLAYSL